MFCGLVVEFPNNPKSKKNILHATVEHDDFYKQKIPAPSPVPGSKPKAPAALQTKVNPAFMSVVRPDWALEEDVMLLDPQDQAGLP